MQRRSLFALATALAFVLPAHADQLADIKAKGQIVIPKAARDTFGLKEGDRLVVLGDENQGIALVKAEVFEERMRSALSAGAQPSKDF